MLPGLSDAHMHLSETFGDGQLRNDAHWMYTALRTANAVENFLMLCFTTVRDLVGPVFGLKRAVDEGVVHEPRIYLSGTYIRLQGMGICNLPMNPVYIYHEDKCTLQIFWDGALWWLGFPKS
jgi:imidazolonepropionase-like amidohydrolase